jgi:biotin carboxylase
MPIYYVTRDIERALGKKPDEHYRIITNAGAYAESIKKKYPGHVFLISRKTGELLLDTHTLLAHSETAKIISMDSVTSGDSSIIVFKNTARIEALCEKKKWKLLNPPAAVTEKIENKITQVEWLGEAVRYLLPHRIKRISDINADIERPFILQWAHSHTGDGTMLIQSGVSGEKILADLKKKFPDREGRITKYVRGPMFTVNVCISKDILIGNISYQITGMVPFTDNPFATIGNDWSLPHTLLSERKLAEFNEITKTVGQKMLADSWTGLFGIDCIYDEERDTIHLIEVNARQPASATYESELQAKTHGTTDVITGMTIFEAHIVALAGTSGGSIIEINDGAQIIDRVKKDSSHNLLKTVEDLRQKKYTVIEYENTKLGADHIRIQSEHGIMSAHNAFNSRGIEIVAAVML